MYGDNENIVQQESHKYTTPEVNEGLLTQKLTNCEMEYDLFCCQDFTKPLWLDFRKINDLKKLYLLVRTLNMNDDNEKNYKAFKPI